MRLRLASLLATACVFPGSAWTASGGPDTFGYMWFDSNDPGGPSFSMVAGGTHATTVEACDDCSQSVPIGFSFPFYGTTRTTLSLSSNGHVLFGGDELSFTNSSMPILGAVGIFPFYDDFNPAVAGSAESILYGTSGTAPNRVFHATWSDVQQFSGATAATATFQLQLWEDGTIEFHYADVTLDAPYTGGLSATIGIQGSGTQFLQRSFNTAVLTDSMAIRFEVPPTVAEANGPYSGNEGSAISLGSAGSVGSTFAWDCTSNGTTDFTTATANCVYTDEGSYIATLTVNATATDTALVTVGNVAPTLGSTSMPDGDEGVALTFTAAATDPGSDTLTYAWDFDDGTTALGASVTHVFQDDGNHLVCVSVSDGDGGADGDCVDVEIENVPPVVTLFTVPGGVEGQSLAFAGAATDVAADPLSYAWNFGDGGTASIAAPNHTYADEGSYTVMLTVTDGDGGSSTSTGTAVVTNANPVISSLTGPATGAEGASLTWTAVTSDAGVLDSRTYTWSWGDGSSNTVTSTGSASHTYTANGAFTVTLTVTDGDGGSATASAGVSISNLPPLLGTFTVGSGNEGSPVAMSATAADPGGDPLTFAWNFGDGSVGSGANVSHTYVDEGSYTVTLLVSDGQGGSVTQVGTATVANVAPVVSTAADDGPQPEGTAVTFTATAADVGTADVLTYTWDFGDAGSATGAAPTHVYDDDGTWTVTLTVSDGDGGSDSVALTVMTTNVAPAFISTPPLLATEGELYLYELEYTDPGGADSLTVTLAPSAPSGLALIGTSLEWTPTYGDSFTNPHAVTVTVEDDDGGSDAQTFLIEVVFADQDGDAMADSWEAANGLDPADPADGAFDPDLDGLTNLDEFLGGTDPATYDGPTAPVLVEPIAMAETGLEPQLFVDGAADPQGDPLLYTFEVFLDAAMTTVVDGAIDEGTGTPAASWKVNAPLTENTVYYWRAAASDGHVLGPFAALEAFVVNAVDEPPTMPVPLAPLDGDLVPGLTPALSWSESTDADLDAVAYDVIVWDAGGNEVTSTVDEPALTWTVDITLVENGDYTWSVRAVDEDGLASEWTDPQWFRAVGEDEAPVGVILIDPADGGSVESQSPTLLAVEGTDPEGLLVTHRFQVDAVDTFDSFDFHETTVEANGSGESLWSLAVDGIELPENVWVFARVRGEDAGGVVSAWDTITFFVRGPNDAPAVPVLVAPADGEAFIGFRTQLVADEPTDPENDVVALDFVVARDAALTDVLLLEENVLVGTGPADDGTSWDLPNDLEGTYYWSARSVDEFGAASQWAAPWSFELGYEEPDVGPPGGGDGCDCEDLGGGGSAVLVLALAPALRRRRR